jgi:tetratricopeptide (TPR) repeat protein
MGPAIRIIRKFLFLGICCLGTSRVSSQVRAPQLRNIWENSGISDSLRFVALDSFFELNYQINPDTSIKYLKYQLWLSKVKNNLKQQFLSHKNIGNVLRLQKQFDLAMHSYKTAEQLAIQLKDPVLMADVKINLGNVFVYKNNYASASKLFYEALAIYEQGSDIEKINRAKTALGNVFLIIRKFDLALELYQQVYSKLEFNEKTIRTRAILLNNMGLSFFWMGNYQKAKDYYLSGNSWFETIGDVFYLNEGYSDLARVYYELQEFDSALYFVNKSIECSKNLNANGPIWEVKVVKSKVLFQINFSESFKLAKELFKDIDRYENVSHKMELAYIMHQCYRKVGDYKSALRMHELYTQFKDSFNHQIYQYNIIQEVIQRKHDKHLAQIQLQNKRQQYDLKIQQLKTVIAILGVFFILISIGTYVFQTYKKRNKQLKEQLLAEINDLKHSLGSTLDFTHRAFELDRLKIETGISRRLNETDWKVLNILMDAPTISNKEISNKAHLSVDGIGSSLRRMYDFFDVGESKYKKIALITKAMNLSK